MVIFDEVFDVPLYERTGQFRFMVEVDAKDESLVRCFLVEPRVIGRRAVVVHIPVHLSKRTVTVRMIVDHVHDYGKTILMTRINKLLILF